MAEALIADLRIGLTKFDADLRRATQAAERGTASITGALNKVDQSLSGLSGEFNRFNRQLQETERQSTRAAQASEKHSAVLGRMKGALGALGLLVTAQQFVQFAASAVRSAEAMTGVQQQLRVLTGSTQAA